MRINRIYKISLLAVGIVLLGADAVTTSHGQERGRNNQRTQSRNSSQEDASRSRGYLGASVESSSRPKGLRIEQVYANTAAARANLKKGDIILKMNGAAVTSSSALIGQLSKTKPGQKATLLVSSGGKTKTMQIQLGGSYSTRSSARSGSTRSGSSSRSRGSTSSSRGSTSRSSQQRSSQSIGKDQNRSDNNNNRRDLDMDAMRKRIEAGVRSGKIKREDAAKMLEGLRKRMESANRGEGDKKEESKEDPRLARYRAAERHFAAEIKAGKLSKEDAQKKLIEVRKRLWGGGDKRKQSNDNNRKRTGDIVDVAAGNKSFRTLVAAVKAAGLVDTLKGKGPYTVFAPTDAAFAKLPKGTLQSLLKPENKKKLASILTYHVVPGKVLAKDVKSGRVKTANGSSFEVKVSKEGVTVGKAKVVATDVMASNGVIHVIDAVIIPKSNVASRSSSSRESSRRTPQRSSSDDRRKEREERERAERSSRGRGNDRGDDMRKAWEERIKQWRESRERGRDRDDDDRDRRDWSRQERDDRNDRGDDMRRALGEWMERAREMRERSERDSRARSESGRDQGRPSFGRGGPGRGEHHSGASRGGPQRRGYGSRPQGRWGSGRR